MEEPLLSSSTSATAAIAANASLCGEATASSALAIKSSTVLTRLLAILTLAVVSLWANYEASKGFDISIVNSASGSYAGHRFDLLFVSNGRANRIIYQASQFVEHALYPDERYPRKPIDRVTLIMASHNVTAIVSVSPRGDTGDYAVYLSPSLMSMADTDATMASALHRAVARLWLWDGQRTAPEQLLDAIVDYLAMKAGFPPSSGDLSITPSESNEPFWTAEFLDYCEARKNGFVAELNREMREQWTEFTADEALGAPVRRMLAAYRLSTSRIRESFNSTLDSVGMRQAM